MTGGPQEVQQQRLRAYARAYAAQHVPPREGTTPGRLQAYLQGGYHTRERGRRKMLWWLEYFCLAQGYKRWTRSRQRALIERTRAVKALPRRALAAAPYIAYTLHRPPIYLTFRVLCAASSGHNLILQVIK